jgi:hypothetical protein
MSNRWTITTNRAEVCRRAAGRRRYHAQRRFERDCRRALVARMLRSRGRLERGDQARLAQELGVSEATVSRDVAAIFAGTGTTRSLRRLPVAPRGQSV